MSDFLNEIRHREGILGPYSHAKFHHCHPKIAEIGNYWYKFAKKGKSLKRFLQNLVWKRETQVRTLMLNFTVVALQMWAYSPKMAKKW